MVDELVILISVVRRNTDCRDLQGGYSKTAANILSETIFVVVKKI